MLSRNALAIVLATTITMPALAETPEEALASRFRAASVWLDANLEKESVPGAAIGMVHDQELIWSHQFGVESYSTANPVTDDTLFSICSVSKLFNGVAAMNLVDEGLLDLDAPLSQYDASMALPDKLGSEEPVTTRGILSHVAGLPREGTLDYWADNSFPDVAGLRETVSTQEQLYKPYDHWQYSNLGMAMLGDVVSKLSGKSWGEYVDQTIFSPLGMDGSATDMPFDRAGNGFAQGYYIRSAKGERKAVEPHSFRAFAPAAGIASSVNDIAKFASWNFRLLDKGGEEILKATTLKNMQRVHWVGADFEEPAWGLAYATRRYNKKTMWGHGGYCPGARTEFVMRLPTKVAAVMMVSANDVSPGAMVKTVYSLTEKAIAKVHGKLAKDAKKTAKAEKSKSSVNLSAFEGSYHVANYDWDLYVGVNEDGLFAIPIFANDPTGALETWVHEEGDVFRRKRKDDTLAEAITFERDAAGNVISLVQHSYRSTKR
ncbi:MAG: serine hydrolase domain-containing protein [Parasphingorhabdus sp.]|uniref:serine hydrolase domain-containing protein n=1 Tax=Parasphingorhabdus sp. TaxID=2709688 RepID=UPI0032639543